MLVQQSAQMCLFQYKKNNVWGTTCMHFQTFCSFSPFLKEL